uniref:BED-type domain-containing protein n=1 Tax=Gadus morhua TaxID=8049 RepID=A0A8C5FPP2_GADMO
MKAAAESDSTFARWAYAHYFQFDRDKDTNNLIVKCTLCVKPKDLSTSRNSTSNLTKHLARCHANIKLVTKKRKQTEDESGEKTAKQQKLTFSHSAMLEPREVRRLVPEYVVEDMLPLSTGESPSFRNIVSKIPVQASNDTGINKNKTNLKGPLKNSNTCPPPLIFGVQITEATSGKAAIACKQFRGRHTFDQIAAEIEEIFSEYGLTHDKVTACVTDNGTNFVKCFKEYQYGEAEGEVELTDLQSVLLTAEEEDAQAGLCVLPPHHRCAAHTLNLIVNNEVDKWLATNPVSRVVYRNATAKCSALWTKTSRSTVASDCLEEVGEKKLIVPTVTRWNKFYDAYARITEMPLTNINNLCTQFQIKCMNDREYQFLKEYCAIMKPFTVALDILQGEDTCFYGTLQPTIEVLMAKTLAMRNGLSPMTNGLPEVIVGAIKTRFAATIDSKAALLASVSLPKFKLRWVKEETKRDHITFLLTTECRSLPTEEPAALMPDAPQPAITSYLNSAPVMESLHQFPRIKRIALRYNAPTPSSAPVERLFSLGSLVLTPKRNRLGDGRFQRLLLLRYNSCIEHRKIY